MISKGGIKINESCYMIGLKLDFLNLDPQLKTGSCAPAITRNNIHYIRASFVQTFVIYSLSKSMIIIIITKHYFFITPS